MKQGIYNIITTLNEIGALTVSELDGNEFYIRSSNRVYSPKFHVIWFQGDAATGTRSHFVAYFRRPGISKFPMFSIYNLQQAVDFVTAVRSMENLRCKRFT